MKTMVFGLGGAQVLISSLIFGFVAWLFGVSPEGAIVIGGMLAMSSTAIVMKLLSERFEQNSPQVNWTAVKSNIKNISFLSDLRVFAPLRE